MSQVTTSANDFFDQYKDMSVEQVQTNVTGFIKLVRDNLPGIIGFGLRLLWVIALFIVGKWLIRWLRGRVRLSMEKKNTDKGVAQFTDSLLKYALYILLILFVAANLGIELSGITVIFASASVGISLALQQTLANFMGGIFILLMKPFSVGDYIVEEAGGNEGTVTEIQTFYTKLNTIDNRTVVIPNGTLANTSITNVTARAWRQLDLRVGIGYNSDLKKAKEVLESVVDASAYVIKGEEVTVFVDSLGESSVNLGIRAWVKTSDYWKARWDMLENIKLAFDEQGIEIPFNQLTVHMDK